MIVLTSIEVYNFILNINHTNNNFDFYTDTFDEFSFAELKNELEEILSISVVKDEHLQDEIIGPRKISTYRKLETEKKQTDGYIILLMS